MQHPVVLDVWSHRHDLFLKYFTFPLSFWLSTNDLNAQDPRPIGPCSINLFLLSKNGEEYGWLSLSLQLFHVLYLKNSLIVFRLGFCYPLHPKSWERSFTCRAIWNRWWGGPTGQSDLTGCGGTFVFSRSRPAKIKCEIMGYRCVLHCKHQLLEL